MAEATIERRKILRLGAIGFSVASTFPAFLSRAVLRASGAPEDPRTLVVIQLSGGNDGLSTVVPYSDPAYGRARRATRVPEAEVLKLDERVGLHPGLKELKSIYDEGQLAIVQGVSYPNPTRSHFESMDVWHTASREGARRGSGWLGRAIDSACGNEMNPLHALSLGGSAPLALLGERSRPVAFRDPGSYRWRGGKLDVEAFHRLNSPAGAPLDKAAGVAEPLDYLRRIATDANASSEAIRKASASGRPAADYPAGNRLAADLQLIATILAAGLPTRIAYASLGGFDTHANQRGPHDNLLRTFSTAVAAFLKDIAGRGLAERVIVLVFSEFGRRVEENGSRGTDHGVAAPMFLLGKPVRGGLHSKHPSLNDLVNGDLAMTVDFRQVYATLLDGWLGAPSAEVLGGRWEPMPLLHHPMQVRAF